MSTSIKFAITFLSVSTGILFLSMAAHNVVVSLPIGAF